MWRIEDQRNRQLCVGRCGRAWVAVRFSFMICESDGPLLFRSVRQKGRKEAVLVFSKRAIGSRALRHLVRI